jgi:benzoylformate decarboxylase
MDELVRVSGHRAPWPGFAEVRLSNVAITLRCPARRIRTHAELVEVLDEVVPTLPERATPLLLDIDVIPETGLP